MHVRIRHAAALAAALALAGCGGEGDGGNGGPTEPPTAPPVATICPEDAGKHGFDATALVGETLAAAKRTAAEHGCTVRPVKVDGEDMAVTMDVRTNRVNVEVESDKVTAVKGVY